MRFKPLHDLVLIERYPEETVTSGGIIIPGKSAEKPLKGKIIAVGAGKILDSGEVRPLAVGVGEVVYFGKYAGTEIKIEGTDYLLMHEGDLVGTEGETK